MSESMIPRKFADEPGKLQETAIIAITIVMHQNNYSALTQRDIAHFSFPRISRPLMKAAIES